MSATEQNAEGIDMRYILRRSHYVGGVLSRLFAANISGCSLFAYVIILLFTVEAYCQINPRADFQFDAKPQAISPDYRKTYWGMNKKQVIAAEGGYEMSYQGMDRVMCENIIIQGLLSNICYGFKDNKLVEAVVFFK